jgi:formylglycine-generating enzyme
MKTKSNNAVWSPRRTAFAAAVLAASLVTGFMSGLSAQTAPASLKVVSDNSWRSIGTDPYVPPSLPTWVNPAYDDSGWSDTVIVVDYRYPPHTFIPGTLGEQIWHSPQETLNAWFRKSFIVPGFPGRSQAIIRVDDAYELYLNGIAVGSKPNVQPSDEQSYNITPYLREGLNVFAVKAWDIIDIERALLFDATVEYTPNNAPVANAGADQSVALGAQVLLDGSGSADDHTTVSGLSCLWTIESAPPDSEATITESHTLLPSWVPDVPGEYIVKLLVLDASGLPGTDEMTVTVSQPMPNGSFEQDLDGWEATGNVTALASATSTDGAKLACYNSGNTTPNGVLSRTFATHSGSTYMVTFDTGIIAFQKGSQSMKVDVIGVESGTVRSTQTFTLNSPGGGMTTWKSRTLFFTAYDAETTIRFSDISATTKVIDLLLDNVAVESISGLRNGGFEQGLAAWLPIGNVKVNDVGTYPPTEGRQVAAFNGDNTPPNGVLTQHIKVQPGTGYILSFDMGVLAYNTAEQSMQVAIQGSTVPGLFKVRGLGSGKARWETMRIPFIANYDVISVSFIDASASTSATDLLLDRVRIEPASLLRNAGFELELQAWTAGGNVAVKSSNPYKPSEGAKLATFNSANSTPNGTLTQQLFFANMPGATYSLTFDMGTLAYNTNTQSMRVDVEEPGATTQSFTFDLKGIGGGKCNWVTRKLVFTANSGDATISFRDISTNTNNIDLLLDNVRIAPPGDGFVEIPAGNFQMGDSRGDSSISGDPYGETPVHTVFVSAFMMAQTETTKLLWDGVRNWATTHGYTDLAFGTSNGPNHPVGGVSWAEVVKWCNARSEMDGLKPCYTIAGAIYRSGAYSNAVVCDWSANGYRLPSEAEWEKAARGGSEGFRFPWGDVISHHHAAIREYGYLYEAIGDRILVNHGHTSVVGSFPANGWGLHDMSGNVWEHCWDLWQPGYYAVSPSIDPRGPDTSVGFERMIRGGGGASVAVYLRASHRAFYFPTNRDNPLGFRVARSL